MFHPKSPLTKGSSVESAVKGKGRIRKFFDLDADDETIKFYQKKDFFAPTNEKHLKMVLQTSLQNETTQFGSRSVFIWAAVCVSDTDRLCGLCHSRSVSKLLNVAANCVFPCHTSYFADK
jgi:hypothetical protein